MYVNFTHCTTCASLTSSSHILSLDHQVVIFDYGLGCEDPMDHVWLYSKSSPNDAMKLKKKQVSHMLPKSFSEIHIRLYCKTLNREHHEAAWK